MSKCDRCVYQLKCELCQDLMYNHWFDRFEELANCNYTVMDANFYSVGSDKYNESLKNGGFCGDGIYPELEVNN